MSKANKILIVEDEQMLSNIVKAEFIFEGYKTEIAKDGNEALILAKSFRPDAMLLDLILPKKGGLEVLKELKEDNELKNIVVIILSNLAGDGNISKALDMGAADYFVKTQSSISEVIEKVKNCLEN